ncbi:hypothetical protein INT48_001648 [Thamnidium elegans]|uniref:F-box domain-containing protein n=1 Tax=Thamnidium elegans TaxID=101142 RepID=A0A8H7SNC0_9FUNG|nr:hypothetical protein INT48_001648 [Thamnidium elegans]
MSGEKLPAEILDQIFQHLGPKKTQLYECAVVCKSWHLPAIQLFCKNILLRHEPRKIWSKLVSQQDNINVGTWVQKLLVQSHAVKLTDDEFLCILNYMPYLKVIDLRWTVEASDQFSNLVKNNHIVLDYIEELIFCKWADKYVQFVDYFICAYQFRASLKYLDLGYLNYIHLLNTRSGSATEFLKEFKNLQFLSIDNKRASGGTPTLCMFGVLASCNNNLIKLSVENHFTEPINQVLLINPVTRLQYFKAKICHFTQFHANYVSINFPKHLKIFKLKLTQTNASIWVSDNTEFVMQTFGKYLSGVTEVDIVIDETDTLDGMEYDGLQSHLTVSNYWQMIGAIVSFNESTMHCHLSITVKDLISYQTYSGIQIKRNKTNMTISYSMDTSHLIEHNDLFTPGLDVGPSAAFNTHCINSIQVVITTPMISVGKCLDFLESILPVYPHLRFLMISYWYFNVYGEYILKFASAPSIFALNVPVYDTDPYFYFQNQMFESTSSRNTVESFKYVLMENSTLVPSDVKRIGYLLPHMKVLKIVAIERNTQPHLLLDLTGIIELQKLILDFRFLGTFSNTYLQIEQGSKIRYWKISTEKKSFQEYRYDYFLQVR